MYGAFTNESGKTLSGNTIKAGNNNEITFNHDVSNEITFKLYGAYANIVDANNYQSTAEKTLLRSTISALLQQVKRIQQQPLLQAPALTCLGFIIVIILQN